MYPRETKCTFLFRFPEVVYTAKVRPEASPQVIPVVGNIAFWNWNDGMGWLVTRTVSASKLRLLNMTGTKRIKDTTL